MNRVFEGGKQRVCRRICVVVVLGVKLEAGDGQRIRMMRECVVRRDGVLSEPAGVKRSIHIASEQFRHVGSEI